MNKNVIQYSGKMKVFYIFIVFFLINSEVFAESKIRVLSSSRELIYHSVEGEAKYYLITYDAPLRIAVSGKAELSFLVMVNLPGGKRLGASVPLVVQMDGLRPRKFNLPPPEESKGIFLGEVSFFPSTACKIQLDVPEGEHFFTFSVPKGIPAGISLKPEVKVIAKINQPEEKRRREIIPFLIFGAVSDSYGINPSFVGGGGIEIKYPFGNKPFLSLYGSYRAYSQEYKYFTVDNNTEIQSGLEHLLSFNSFAGYGFVIKKFVLSPLVGILGNFYILGDATNLLIGPSGGIEAEMNLFDKSRLRLQTVFTYDLIKESGEKPVGVFPYADLNYTLTISLWRSFLGYSGEYLFYPEHERIDGSGTLTRFAVNKRLYHSFIAGYIF